MTGRIAKIVNPISLAAQCIIVFVDSQFMKNQIKRIKKAKYKVSTTAFTYYYVNVYHCENSLSYFPGDNFLFGNYDICGFIVKRVSNIFKNNYYKR